MKMKWGTQMTGKNGRSVGIFVLCFVFFYTACIVSVVAQEEYVSSTLTSSGAGLSTLDSVLSAGVGVDSSGTEGTSPPGDTSSLKSSGTPSPLPFTELPARKIQDRIYVGVNVSHPQLAASKRLPVYVLNYSRCGMKCSFDIIIESDDLGADAPILIKTDLPDYSVYQYKSVPYKRDVYGDVRVDEECGTIEPNFAFGVDDSVYLCDGKKMHCDEVHGNVCSYSRREVVGIDSGFEVTPVLAENNLVEVNANSDNRFVLEFTPPSESGKFNVHIATSSDSEIGEIDPWWDSDPGVYTSGWTMVNKHYNRTSAYSDGTLSLSGLSLNWSVITSVTVTDKQPVISSDGRFMVLQSGTTVKVYNLTQTSASFNCQFTPPMAASASPIYKDLVVYSGNGVNTTAWNITNCQMRWYNSTGSGYIYGAPTCYNGVCVLCSYGIGGSCYVYNSTNGNRLCTQSIGGATANSFVGTTVDSAGRVWYQGWYGCELTAFWPNCTQVASANVGSCFSPYDDNEIMPIDDSTGMAYFEGGPKENRWLKAVNVTNGNIQLLWQSNMSKQGEATGLHMCRSGGALYGNYYVCVDGPANKTCAYNVSYPLSNGTKVWCATTGYISGDYSTQTPPVIDSVNNVVYAAGNSWRTLLVLNLTNGNLLYNISIPGANADFNLQPVITNNTIYAVFGNNITMFSSSGNNSFSSSSSSSSSSTSSVSYQTSSSSSSSSSSKVTSSTTTLAATNYIKSKTGDLILVSQGRLIMNSTKIQLRTTSGNWGCCGMNDSYQWSCTAGEC